MTLGERLKVVRSARHDTCVGVIEQADEALSNLSLVIAIFNCKPRQTLGGVPDPLFIAIREEGYKGSDAAVSCDRPLQFFVHGQVPKARGSFDFAFHATVLTQLH